MTKEELAKKYIPVPYVEWQEYRDEFMIDLNETIRGELISFTKKNFTDIVGDEEIFVDGYLKTKEK